MVPGLWAQEEGARVRLVTQLQEVVEEQEGEGVDQDFLDHRRYIEELLRG